MRGKRNAAGVAIACLAAATPARAQEAPGAPQIYDARGRRVGAAIQSVSSFGLTAALLSLHNGEAVLHIGPEGFRVGGPAPVTGATNGPETHDSGSGDLYYLNAGCQGDAYVRVVDFPNYGRFIPAPWQIDGFSRSGKVVYAARPFTTVILRAAGNDAGDCSAIGRPFSALVGLAATADMPAFKLPLVTR